MRIRKRWCYRVKEGKNIKNGSRECRVDFILINLVKIKGDGLYR